MMTASNHVMGTAEQQEDGGRMREQSALKTLGNGAKWCGGRADRRHRLSCWC